jgi:hypothetical protein
MEHLEKVSSSNETHQNIMHQPSSSNPFAPLLMDSSAASLLKCADLSFLDNLNYASGQRHQAPWTTSPMDGLAAEGSFFPDQRGLFSAFTDIYPEWQEDTKQPRGLKYVSKLDKILSGNILEEETRFVCL